jgi:hypothetical protein
MTCDHAVDLIVDSLLDRLDAEQRRELDAHLASCASCAAEAERMSEMWEGLGRLPAPEPASGAALELGRRLAAERAAIALLLLGAAGGYGLRGGGPEAVTSSDATTFMLLVRGDERMQAPVSGDALVREYMDWASSLRERGRLVGANKLMDEPGRWVSTAAAETRLASDVSGYFLITAADYDEAIRIAEDSPHIRYGGTFEIRRVDPLQ